VKRDVSRLRIVGGVLPVVLIGLVAVNRSATEVPAVPESLEDLALHQDGDG